MYNENVKIGKCPIYHPKYILLVFIASINTDIAKAVRFPFAFVRIQIILQEVKQ